MFGNWNLGFLTKYLVGGYLNLFYLSLLSHKISIRICKHTHKRMIKQTLLNIYDVIPNARASI